MSPSKVIKENKASHNQDVTLAAVQLDSEIASAFFLLQVTQAPH